MQQSAHHTVTIRFLPRRNWFALGPGWAVIAAALSVSTDTPASSWLLPLLLLWLIADPLLGSVWHLVLDDRPSESQPSVAGRPWLPYTQANSLSYRLSAGLKQLWHDASGLWTSVLVGAASALALGGVLGPVVAGYVLLSLVLLGWVSRRPQGSGWSRPFWQAVALFGLPYALSLGLVGGFNALSSLLGCAYWVVYLGSLSLPSHPQAGQRLVLLGQMAVVALLVAFVQPIAATICALCTVFILLLRLLNQHEPDKSPRWFGQAVQPFLLISLLVAAGFSGGGWL